MVDQPWLYLCPKAITSGFRIQRFVFLNKTDSDHELVPALFQYIMETLDLNSTENNQVLRSQTVEVGPLSTAVSSWHSITRKGSVTPLLETPLPSTPKPEKSASVAAFPPLKLSLTSSMPIFESDVLLVSIVSAIESKGFFFASSFMTPLVMRVIPTILKKTDFLLGNQLPLDFTKNGSFFRVLRQQRASRDGYGPWNKEEMVSRHLGGTKVMRYDYTHPCSDKFTRYIFMIESKEMALYQYVLDGPIRKIAWRGGRRAQKEYMDMHNDADDTPEEPKAPEENAPRSISTRSFKVPDEK